jgi:hypothetical protein
MDQKQKLLLQVRRSKETDFKTMPLVVVAPGGFA